ncbi:hypothetical protein [Pelagicoccus mobilis]|uniref:Transporter n=1 Tax=Pelagicoccus mobilis TaxID=415221 RepID=A0A934RYY2_9BACT|nr:hypothetical protein [Pelagicoccus mobilis]MBK1879302.1 hypothetical protein [Pelagicoccus mobilis]
MHTLIKNKTLLVKTIALLALTGLAPLQAQEGKADRSGTNPINFTNDFRIYNDYRSLSSSGEDSQNVTTMEYRTPFADGKWQFRVRAYANKLDVDSVGLNEFGFGDMDMRFLTVPILDMPNKFAMATGLEVFMPTNSDDALGNDAWTLGPQIFLVKFLPFNGAFDLIAPGYQYRISIDEDGPENKVGAHALDLFLLKTLNNKQQWIMINPQGFIDDENDIEFGNIDIEIGSMLGKDHGGQSVYVRPAFAFGADRPYDVSLELGYKYVW